MTGTIKSLPPGKEFGFISQSNGDKDVFFHTSEVVAPLAFADLKIGDTVTFELQDSPKGPKATQVARA